MAMERKGQGANSLQGAYWPGSERLGTKCITICQTKLNTLDNTDDVCTFVSANIILELELDALANPSHPIDDIGEES